MENTPFKRWYDEDQVVTKCVVLLESLSDNVKRQTATYLMDEIINKPPYSEMMASDIFNLATGESRKRRWYDFDEVVRIFVELLRHSNAEIRKEMSILAITFIEDLK